MAIFVAFTILGSSLVIVGLYWSIRTLRRFFLTQMTSSVIFNSIIWFPCMGYPKIPFDAGVALFFSVLSLIGHLAAGFDTGNSSINAENILFSLMYFAFSFHLMVAILKIYKVYVFSDVDYITLTVAYVVETLVFSIYLQQTSQLELRLFSFLILCIVVKCVCIGLEMAFRTSIFLPLARAYLTLLQGSWLCQVALILHLPSSVISTWNLENRSNLVIVTTIFSGHCLGHLILILVVASLVRRCVISTRIHRIVIPLATVKHRQQKEEQSPPNKRGEESYFQFKILSIFSKGGGQKTKHSTSS